MLTFTCAYCDSILTCSESNAGRKILCALCGQAMCELSLNPVTKTLLGEILHDPSQRKSLLSQEPSRRASPTLLGALQQSKQTLAGVAQPVRTDQTLMGEIQPLPPSQAVPANQTLLGELQPVRTDQTLVGEIQPLPPGPAAAANQTLLGELQPVRTDQTLMGEIPPARSDRTLVGEVQQPPAAPGSIKGSNYYIHTVRDGKTQGPYSSAQLRQLATSGRLLPDDLVCKEGAANWAAARAVGGLFSGSR